MKTLFVSAFLNLKEDRSKDKSVSTCFPQTCTRHVSNNQRLGSALLRETGRRSNLEQKPETSHSSVFQRQNTNVASQAE